MMTENEADDHEIIDEVDDSNKNEQDEDSDGTIEPEDSDNEKEDSEEEEHEKKEDSICEIFSRVFVNDSWSCVSQVEKSYYSAGIYPDICIECGNLDVTRVEKGEHPRCNNCSGNTSVSKKRLKWKRNGKDKGKRKVV